MSEPSKQSKLSRSRERAAEHGPVHAQDSYRVCLRPDLLATYKALMTEYTVLEQKSQRPSGAVSARAARLSPLSKSERARFEELAAKLLPAVVDEMEEESGELLLTAIDFGAWHQWCAENPGREDDITDGRLLGGLCDAEAMARDLDRWIVSFDGVPLTDGDLDHLITTIAPGDVSAILSRVLVLHEGQVDLGKLRDALPGVPSSSAASDSPLTTG